MFCLWLARNDKFFADFSADQFAQILGRPFGIEHVKGSAKTTERELFAFDLTYAAVMEARNLLPNQIHPVMMIDAPRLMFPFARAIIAEETRNGGFPPLYIEPVDFFALYRQKLEEVAGKKIMQ